MRAFPALLTLALPLAAQQSFDFKTLDKLDSLTDHKTKISLEAGMLRLAAAVLGNDGDQEATALKSVVQNLKGIYVRSWEFAKENQYAQADLEPLRTFLRQQQWSRIVEAQDGRDISEVYVQPLSGDRFGGVAIIDAEPLELTIVYINGAINLSDLEKLSGNMGIPDLKDAIPRKSIQKQGASKKKEH
jgi:hypothetical protein